MRGGMIIRLIDVVLILLFGFLAISDIQVKRQIRLPGPSRDQKQQPLHRDTYIFVGIDRQKVFVIRVNNEERFSTTSLDDLRAALVKEAQGVQSSGGQAVVVIDPQPDASVQSTIDVFDICEEEGLAKSINMQLAEQRGSNER